MPDHVAALGLIAQHLPLSRRAELHGAAVRNMRWRWLRQVGLLMERGRVLPALAYARDAYRGEDLATRGKAMFGYSKWAIKVAFCGPIARNQDHQPIQADHATAAERGGMPRVTEPSRPPDPDHLVAHSSQSQPPTEAVGPK